MVRNALRAASMLLAALSMACSLDNATAPQTKPQAYLTIIRQYASNGNAGLSYSTTSPDAQIQGQLGMMPLDTVAQFTQTDDAGFFIGESNYGFGHSASSAQDSLNVAWSAPVVVGTNPSGLYAGARNVVFQATRFTHNTSNLLGYVNTTVTFATDKPVSYLFSNTADISVDPHLILHLSCRSEGSWDLQMGAVRYDYVVGGGSSFSVAGPRLHITCAKTSDIALNAIR